MSGRRLPRIPATMFHKNKMIDLVAPRDLQERDLQESNPVC